MAKPNTITADASLAQARKSAPYFKKLLKGMHMGGASSFLREADYKGRHITIKTTYQVTIDGKPFDGVLGVSNAGTVHYHGMPNTGFASALDLIKAVIDVFPEEFAKGSRRGGGGMHMPGMDMKKSSVRKKAARKHSTRK